MMGGGDAFGGQDTGAFLVRCISGDNGVTAVLARIFHKSVGNNILFKLI